MNNVYIYRFEESDQGIKSRLYTDIGFMCKVLELPWRNNKRNISCIPEGKYRAVPYTSTKLGRCYHIQDVENRTWILTHSGNLAGDRNLGWQTHSWGCLLLGQSFGRIKNKYGNFQKAVLNSRYTLNLFISYMLNQPFVLDIEKSIYYRKV